MVRQSKEDRNRYDRLMSVLDGRSRHLKILHRVTVYYFLDVVLQQWNERKLLFA